MHFALYATRALAALTGLARSPRSWFPPPSAPRQRPPTPTPPFLGLPALRRPPCTAAIASQLRRRHSRRRKNLDRFFGERFGKAYTAPGVSWINEAGGTATGCGNLDIDQGWKKAAFYCPADKVVYLDITFLRYENDAFGYDGVMSVMAHEYGHHIQNLYPSTLPKLAAGTTLRKAREWQADCYAGATMRWMTTGLTAVDHQGLLAEAAASGDDGVDPADPSKGYSHGTPAQRMTAFDAGWLATRPATTPRSATRGRTSREPGRGCHRGPQQPR